MLKNGNSVRLTRDERACVEALTGKSCAPTDVVEVKAWLQEASLKANELSPEERLLAAVLVEMGDEI